MSHVVSSIVIGFLIGNYISPCLRYNGITYPPAIMYGCSPYLAGLSWTITPFSLICIIDKRVFPLGPKWDASFTLIIIVSPVGKSVAVIAVTIAISLLSVLEEVCPVTSTVLTVV